MAKDLMADERSGNCPPSSSVGSHPIVVSFKPVWVPLTRVVLQITWTGYFSRCSQLSGWTGGLDSIELIHR
jgi:hypothetical protein